MDRYWVLCFVSVEDSEPGEGCPRHQRKHADLEAAKAEGDRVLDELEGRPWVAFIIHGPVNVVGTHPEPDWRVWKRHQAVEWTVG